jgi:hypothetical protein
MRSRLGLVLILFLQGALVLLLVIAIRARWIPLGVRGEWEWNRLPAWAAPLYDWLGLAGLAIAGYAGLVALGLRSLSVKQSPRAESAWVGGLLIAALAVQVMIPMGAAPGYDLSKWAAVNYFPSSTGYFRIAKEQAVGDPRRFLAEYPVWIRGQDSMHIGTHPPGLIVAQCVLIRVTEQNPALAGFLMDHMPASVEAGFRILGGNGPSPLTAADMAALYATGLLTLLACAGTVVPLYLLARVALPAPAAWAAAAFWPLVPAANLFQPVADTTYPLLSSSAWALASWAARFQQGHIRNTRVSTFLAAASGVVMAFGMVFTLAFLPVGLVVALIMASNRALSRSRRAALLLATGAGFLTLVVGGWIATGADPFVIWRWNLRHHARFYVEYPRTYLLWLWVNPIELAIAAGLPAMVWCAAGLLAPRTVPRAVWATLIVLVLVNLTGRNMGEVARLWMFFLPPLLVGAGHGCGRFGAGPLILAISTAVLGLQTLALQAMIQVVYPV